MKPIFFISDLHLGSPSGDHEQMRHERFRRFVDTACREAGAVYIVGDYFDFWFEYRRAFPIQSLWGVHYLMLLRDAGVDVHFIIGNHDCWGRDLLDRHLGIHTYRHPLECMIEGRRFLLIHGDGVSVLDRRYRWVKPLLRSRLSMALYRWIHPDLGIWLADTMSQWSKAGDLDYAKYANDQSLTTFAQSQFDRGIDVVMMGHHHHPRVEKIGRGTLISLGDWVTHATYAVMGDNGLHLKTWELS